MFNNHPKGLYALALANTGERFGYYTMLAIFVLFLQAKFGLDESTTSTIFGGFLALVYFMPLVGGIIADKWLGYGKTVTIGIIVMFAGYLFLSIPTARDSASMGIMFAALFLIAAGTGLFKGNLQVMVGNLYDDPKYKSQRDNAFSIFYMAINLGALYAPTAATKVTNYFLGQEGLVYNAKIPNLAHQFLDTTKEMDPAGLAEFTNLAATQKAGMELTEFSNLYIDKLSEAYNYGFAVACFSLVVSMLIYLGFRKTYKHADYNAKQLAAQQATGNSTVAKEAELTPQQTKERIVALVLVFSVVIFFWMSFHQNGLTMTFFARDYTANAATGLDRIGFDVLNLTFIIIAVYALFNIFQSAAAKAKAIGGGIFAAAVAALVFNYMQANDSVDVFPQIFQQFNPFFVVVLTPVSLAIFGALASKGKEPSAPRKIGIGMVIAALGFLILAVGSMGLATPEELKATGGVSDTLVSPNWLISTYLVLTFAELLLSPMGISFVSKVAPPKYKGLMMGGWFAATAIGNYLVAIIGYLWGGLPLWLVWGILVALCLISAIFMFSILKKLEKVTNDC
ncbi:POT family proton-dependent oligopeptide transporter [Dysgonomonadaceae bacterium PH5-43]|nr:POT family proton-dependent oligopeptide transporter [Dysgonomonadaceae bacterium PH5-43]